MRARGGALLNGPCCVMRSLLGVRGGWRPWEAGAQEEARIRERRRRYVLYKVIAAKPLTGLEMQNDEAGGTVLDITWSRTDEEIGLVCFRKMNQHDTEQISAQNKDDVLRLRSRR